MILFLISIVIFFTVLYLRGFFDESDSRARVLYFTDAVTVPALAFVSVGTLIWVASFGALDGILYSLKRLGRGLIPFAELHDSNVSYCEYKARDKSNIKRGYWEYLFVGGVLLFISVALTVLYS